MCGIAGIIGPLGAGLEARSHGALGSAMLAALAHRGPDGEGDWASPTAPVWLGHRRLAIIDPEQGHQPMANEDGTVQVSFNGCIYNYLELGQTLRQKGHRFRTHTDTEVIVHAWEEYGEKCVEHFIGMFAFALWDERRGVLFCARDRLGVKPFYYAAAPGRFAFASEIKALVAAGLAERAPDASALREYVTFQAPITERTLFAGVRRLPPGCRMVVDAEGRVRSNERYWDLSFEPDTEHDEEYFVDRLRLLLKDAVKIRLRSDVPLGAHLSGGLDSSTVVCLAQAFNTGADALKTFNGAFDGGAAFDETEYARIVAREAGAELFTVRPGPRDFQDTLPEIIRIMDEPAAGPGVFPQYMVSKLASEHVTVVLGGQGGDEIFAGYARYLVGYLEECLKGAIEDTAQRAEYAATLATIIPSLPMLQQYKPMLRYFWGDGLFDTQASRYLRLMDRSENSRTLYSPDLFADAGDTAERFTSLFEASDATSFLNKMLFFDLKVHLPALLHVEDRTSMAWGLESRVPLLDHRICELMARIPPTIKFRNGMPKYLFRKAIKNVVPDAILARRDKMGFPVPLHRWYGKELKTFVADVLLDSRARSRGIFDAKGLEAALASERSFGRVVWGALCLELWFKQYMD
ncbi:MAG: asparagine synthase (glutamine-hydrolyzing) [Desulfovibrionaceae bacterium]|jgi:asparagine synthase (glutamine-hydrolysing)|nr:asparagine synthase (glutamine-hydrolyzing) [Desulfovibrionaceae bacterium]